MTGLPIPPSPAEPFEPQAAITVLSLALRGKHRPLDDLIARLEAPDGGAWFEHAAAHFAPRLPVGLHGLLHGAASIAQLSAVKDLCKSVLSRAEDTEVALISLAMYCLSVAAALAHHGTLISTQPREEWDLLLIDLADAMPIPWRDMLLAGVMRD